MTVGLWTLELYGSSVHGRPIFYCPAHRMFIVIPKLSDFEAEPHVYDAEHSNQAAILSQNISFSSPFLTF